MVGILAYAYHPEVPTFNIEPNVYVLQTTWFRFTKKTFHEQTLAFREKGVRKMGVYEYLARVELDIPGAAFAGRYYDLANSVRTMSKQGLVSYDGEAQCNWGPNGPGYWILSKVLWNPELDAAQLMDDFCTKAFGKAKEPMRRMYDRWAKREMEFGELMLKQSLLDLQEAYRLTDDPAVLTRLDRLAMYLHWLRLNIEYDRTLMSEPEKIFGRAKTGKDGATDQTGSRGVSNAVDGAATNMPLLSTNCLAYRFLTFTRRLNDTQMIDSKINLFDDQSSIRSLSPGFLRG